MPHTLSNYRRRRWPPCESPVWRLPGLPSTEHQEITQIHHQTHTDPTAGLRGPREGKHLVLRTRVPPSLLPDGAQGTASRARQSRARPHLCPAWASPPSAADAQGTAQTPSPGDGGTDTAREAWVHRAGHANQIHGVGPGPCPLPVL